MSTMPASEPEDRNLTLAKLLKRAEEFGARESMMPDRIAAQNLVSELRSALIGQLQLNGYICVESATYEQRYANVMAECIDLLSGIGSTLRHVPLPTIEQNIAMVAERLREPLDGANERQSTWQLCADHPGAQHELACLACLEDKADQDPPGKAPFVRQECICRHSLRSHLESGCKFCSCLMFCAHNA